MKEEVDRWFADDCEISHETPEFRHGKLENESPRMKYVVDREYLEVQCQAGDNVESNKGPCDDGQRSVPLLKRSVREENLHVNTVNGL